MTDSLAQLAQLAGVADHWIDNAGYRRAVASSSLREILAAMGLGCATAPQLRRSVAEILEARRRPPALLTSWAGVPTRLSFALPTPASFALTYEDGSVVEGQVYDQDGSRWLPPILYCGYHQLEVGGYRIGLAIAPVHACGLNDAGGVRKRTWGVALDSIGVDFRTLATIARTTAGYGADVMAVGNLSAGNRHWLDVSRVDARETFGSIAQDLLREEPNGRSEDHLQLLYREALPRDEVLLREYLRFCREGGAALQQHARHEALNVAGFRQLGGNVRRAPGHDANDRLAGDQQAEAIGYQSFLQWLAARGRAASQAAARSAGMSTGLIVDLEWGAAADGSEVGLDSSAFIAGVGVADPPLSDGVALCVDSRLCFHPLRMVEHGFRPWIDLLRSTMAGVGAIRLPRFDRWQRVWLAAPSSGGAYVEQPFDDLLRLLVLESVRQRCVVIVDGSSKLQAPWAAAVSSVGLLPSCTLLQQDAEQWKPISAWSPRSVAVTSDRTTPSLREWWKGADIQQGLERGQVSARIAARQLRMREDDRAELLAGLGLERRQGGARRPAQGIARRKQVADGGPQDLGLIDEVVTALGRTPCALTLLALNDLMADQPLHAGGFAIEGESLSHLLDAGTVRNRLHRLDSARCDDSAGAPITPSQGTKSI